MAFDMGVNSGNMPTTLVFAVEKTASEEGTPEQENIYILDCGKQYYYVNDEDGVLGDGKIKDTEENLKTIREKLKDCLVSVRRTVYDMNPPALDEKGFTAALRKTAYQISERGNLQVNFL